MALVVTMNETCKMKSTFCQTNDRETNTTNKNYRDAVFSEVKNLGSGKTYQTLNSSCVVFTSEWRAIIT